MMNYYMISGEINHKFTNEKQILNDKINYKQNGQVAIKYTMC